MAVVDTSAIVQLRLELYAPDVFPALNDRFERMLTASKVVTVSRVFGELSNQATRRQRAHGGDVRTLEWAEATIHPIDKSAPLATSTEISLRTAEVASLHQRWSANDTDADPMVIAAAEILGCSVISGEVLHVTAEHSNSEQSLHRFFRNDRGLIPNRRSIADVCWKRGVEHLDLISFFRAQGWSF